MSDCYPAKLEKKKTLDARSCLCGSSPAVSDEMSGIRVYFTRLRQSCGNDDRVDTRCQETVLILNSYSGYGS